MKEEMMDVLDALKKLPRVAYSVNMVDGGLVALKRGVMGYFPISLAIPQSETPRSFADELNKGLGVTPEQESAMVNGSMWGWETPSADPDHEINKKMVAARKTR